MRSTVAAVVGVCVAAVLAAGCSSDDSGGADAPSAEASAALDTAASAAAAPEGVADALPALVAAAAAWPGHLPPQLAAAVLDALAAHPDALRAAYGPRSPGMPEPSADLDRAELEDALAAAGSDVEAATAFRAAYLDYLASGLTQSLTSSEMATWLDAQQEAETVWLDPSADVIAAVESGCAADECFDRVGDAMDQAQAVVDGAAYDAMPDALVPTSMVRAGERVPMAQWTARMSDDWRRLEDSTPLPEIADRIEAAVARLQQGSGA